MNDPLEHVNTRESAGIADNYSTGQSQKVTPIQRTRTGQEEFKQTVTISKSTLEKAINQAKRMTSQGKFDDKAQQGFLKLLEKESISGTILDEQTWTEWIKILNGLVASPDETIRSDSLSVLTTIYDQHPEKLSELTAQGIQEMQLGRLIAAKSPQSQTNLVNYIFTVMLNGDKAVRKCIEESQLALLEEIAEIKQSGTGGNMVTQQSLHEPPQR